MLVFEKIQVTEFDWVLGVFLCTFSYFFIHFQAIIAKLAFSIQVEHSYLFLLLQKLTECQANDLYQIFLGLLVWNGLGCIVRLEGSILETIEELSDLLHYLKGYLPVAVRWM